MASLFVIRGKYAGKHFLLNRDKTTLGRDTSCDIQIVDHEVSRHHAEIVFKGTDFYLNDLTSSNGSFVNGGRVDSRSLRSGDRIQIGRTLMVFTTNTGPNKITPPVAVDIVGVGVDLTKVEELSQIRRTFSSDQESSEPIEIHGQLDSDFSEQIKAIKAESQDKDSFNDTVALPTKSPEVQSHWEVMYRTAVAVSRTMDIDELLQQILELVFQWIKCDRGCVMLTHEETGELRPAARRNRSNRGTTQRIEISKTILDYVIQHREGVLTSNATDDQRWAPGASIVGAGIREAICVPMQGRYGIVGAIYIDCSRSYGEIAEKNVESTFNEENLKLMVAIGHQAALAIEDTFYYRGMVQAERLAIMGQTIATLSHHIKNILQGIRGGSYLVDEGIKREQLETVSKGWRIVERNQERIASLVMDMLTFSKERQPQRTPVDLPLVIQDCVELSTPSESDAPVLIQWNKPEDFPIVHVDSEAIHRAILNVLKNAVDAVSGREDAQVAISLQSSAEHAKVIIKDNGPGIVESDLQKIFSLFESTKGSRGTGLGLPVSQKILKEHGGLITVESQVDQGATFILTLPIQLPPNQDRKHLERPTMY